MISRLHKKLQSFNHLPRALDSVTDVRTGFNPVGVLKRVIRFKSCEKPNDQPVTTWPVGLLARLIQYLFANENHLHLMIVSGKMQNIHLALKLNIPQQPAHLSVRSRMVAVFVFLPLFHLFRPITHFSSFCVMGFFLSIKPEVKRVHH